MLVICYKYDIVDAGEIKFSQGDIALILPHTDEHKLYYFTFHESLVLNKMFMRKCFVRVQNSW